MSYLRGIVRKLYYKLLRPHLPRKIGILYGYPARRPKLLDATDIDETYEDVLIPAIYRSVKPGDDVVVVGGGFGVSSVAAAEEAGKEGSVTAFEPSTERYMCAMDTILMNHKLDQIDFRQAYVGIPNDLSPEPGAAQISPEELPVCDALIMDCEGSEVDVISRMTAEPRVVVVETHGCFDSPTEDVTTALEERGYEIKSIRQDDPNLGIDIVTAVRANS